jgi:hypothetical protein
MSTTKAIAIAAVAAASLFAASDRVDAGGKKAPPPKKKVVPPTKGTTKPDDADTKPADPTPPADADAGKTPPPTDTADVKAPTPPKPTDTQANATNEPDVDTLRQEYLSLRDELFKSRARANAIASQLYSTRISIKLTYTTGRYYNPTKVAIRLDGASVYDDGTGAIAKDDGVRFDGYIAPGRHVVTYRIEATGKDDDSFTSMTETQLVVKAVPGKDLVVAGRGHDSGDIAYNWKREEKGSYGLGIDTSVKTVANAAAGAKGAK